MIVAASAPGSLMLLGEHAVLHGRISAVMAIQRRIRVRLALRPDRDVRIDSSLGFHQTTLDDVAPHPSFRFLLAAVCCFKAWLPRGVDIKVESDFSHTVGFASSAATTVAAVAALRSLSGLSAKPNEILADAVEIIRAVQGRASGADAAAAVFGGVVAYRAEPLEVRKLHATLRGLAVYCGYKTPTPQVIQFVENHWKDRRRELDLLYDRIGANADEGIAALERGDLAAFGRALDQGQLLMDQLGVNTPELQAIVERLRSDPGILGAKISGSGLGDCAIGIGAPTLPWRDYAVFPVETDRSGVRIE